MIRKLILTLVILTASVVPIAALAEDGGHEVRRGHERFEPSEHLERHSSGFYTPYIYTYGPNCGWTQGYWAYQGYVDAYGNYSFVPVWVPAQYVCS